MHARLSLSAGYTGDFPRAPGYWRLVLAFFWPSLGYVPSGPSKKG